MPLPFLLHCIDQAPYGGVVVMVGTPCGVWAMGAMWLSQIMLVSGNDHPKLASGQKGKTWSPMGVCYGLWVGCQIHCNNVVISCNWAVAPTANRQVLTEGWLLCQQGPRQSMWAGAMYRGNREQGSTARWWVPKVVMAIGKRGNQE